MRISVFLRTLPLLLLLASPIALLAQFQQPAEEELKMTTDLKAPGADAVYLNIEEIANDPLHYLSFYTRIKAVSYTHLDVYKRQMCECPTSQMSPTGPPKDQAARG